MTLSAKTRFIACYIACSHVKGGEYCTQSRLLPTLLAIFSFYKVKKNNEALG